MKISQFIKKNRKLLIISAVILAVVLTAILLRPGSSTTETVVTERVKTDNISLLVSASGNIVPKSSYSIIAKVTSKAIEVPVKSGSLVKKGDTLIKFDDTELQNAVKIATYNFNSAIARREQAKAALVYDQNAVNQAQQQINVSYTQLQSAKNAVNNATITAPIDGEVLAVNIKVDEYPSLTLPIMVVADTSRFEAIIPINEIDINKVQNGQNSSLSIDAIGKILNGEVVSIDNNGINTAGIITYQVHIEPDSITGLRPNMTVDADIAVTEKTGVLVVPAAAIQQKNGNYYVKVLANEFDPSSKAIETEVTIGISNNALTEITSGVTEGQIVIINIINSSASSIFNLVSGK